MQGEGLVTELVLLDRLVSARVTCPPGLIPLPGQYVLAHMNGSDSPLADVLFGAQYHADGFIVAPPCPESWRLGARLRLRGPLGQGFVLPPAARRLALIAWNNESRRLLALLEAALKQDAAVTLVCEDPPADLPLQIEIQPVRALADVCKWSDYVAFDVAVESLSELRGKLGNPGSLVLGGEAQALVRTPMPCGGLAECGVCTIQTQHGPRLACVDGPVFDFRSLLLER